MRWLGNTPIRRKLTIFTLATSGAAIALALLLLFAWQLRTAQHEAARDLTTVASVAADNAAGPLAFRDRDAAQSTLTTMRSEVDVVSARLIDETGVEFVMVRFHPNAPPAIVTTGAVTIRGMSVYVKQPVLYRGERLGTLELVGDISGTVRKFALTAGLSSLVVLIAAILVAHLIAASLQRGITEPLTVLAETAQTIARNKDYTVRAPGKSTDEIGRVTAAFNEMLAEIDARDVALRDAHRRLAEQVDQLRHEMAERQRAEEARLELERKLEEAQRLESLGVLAGGIAHDFNNILTGILASASLARLDAQQIEPNLERIEKNARRAAELCQQMLAYAGKGQLHGWSAVDINSLVRDTLELLHVSVPKDAELKLELAPTLPAVHGDSSRIRQVLMNLVLNAAEALGPLPRRLQIGTRRVKLEATSLAQLAHAGEAKPGDYVVIDVADSGVGMTSDTLRRIFEPFYTTKFAGRGLGLSAVLGIVRSHSGALDVSSTPGRGTRFVVYLPVSTAPIPDAVQTPVARPLAASRVPPPNRRSVLVVDDEVDVLELAAVSLRKHGFVVHTAENGAEAVAMFERQPGAFDGVLLDLTMPQMDGLRTLERLRALRPNVRAVLMSGYDPSEAQQRAPGAKPDLFLPKPFGVAEVVDCVQRLLGDEAKR